MVRQTRFSFDEGMKVDYPEPEDEFDDDELDGFVAEAPSPLKKPHAPKRERKRNQPGDRRPDRRHLADGDWLKRSRPEERGGEEERAADRE